jgi:hypothetical protein
MPKLDLKFVNVKNIEIVVTWVFRWFICLLLVAILNNQTKDELTSKTYHDDIALRVENVYSVVTNNEYQPEIPDANNNEYQASCPAESDFLDDPGRVIAFLEAIDPYITEKPWKLQVLMGLLIGDRDSALDYLEQQFSNGYPYQ